MESTINVEFERIVQAMSAAYEKRLDAWDTEAQPATYPTYQQKLNNRGRAGCQDRCQFQDYTTIPVLLLQSWS